MSIKQTIEAIEKLPEKAAVLVLQSPHHEREDFLLGNDLRALAASHKRLLGAGKVLALSMCPTFAEAQTAPVRRQTIADIQNDFLAAIEEAEK